ncbi:hypothetical protein [Escherichia coli]
MFSSDGYGAAIIIFAIVCAVLGWAVIEFILWLFSFVHISFGG